MDLIRLELGVIRCMDEIMEQMSRNTGLSVTDAQIECVLNGKSCSMPEEAVSIIMHQDRLHIEKIFCHYRSRLWPAGSTFCIYGWRCHHFKGLCDRTGLPMPSDLPDRCHANATATRYEQIVGQMRTL